MRLFLFLLMISVAHPVSAQFSLSVNSGYASYKMDDLKSFQDQLSSSFPVKGEITASFPSYWLYGLSARLTYPTKVVGASFTYGSTGGRVYYSDYSGKIGSDQLLTFYDYSGSLGMQKSFMNGHLILLGELKPGITFSHLELTSYESYSGASYDSKANYKGLNVVIQPVVTAIARFGQFGINASFGYNATLSKGNLNEFGNKDSYLALNQTPVHVDWSGWRMGGGLSLFFKEPDNPDAAYDKVSIGAGVGLDYGGFGVNLLVYPQKNIGFFVGAGYALAGVGSNVGIKIRHIKEARKIRPYLTAMHGYNTAVAVKDAKSYNRLFYGNSIGFGFDTRPRKESNGHFSLGFLVPIRGTNVDEYLSFLKNQGVTFKKELSPIAISIGYRFLVK
jgi:hypothetical protein